MSINQDIKDDIVSLLKNCEFRKFCDCYFADNFLWVIKGTSVLSGTYTDKETFFDKGINRLSAALLSDWKMYILNSYTDGNAFIVEMRGEVKTKVGDNYNNEYCWIMHFENKKIVKLTAYYDSLLVNETLRKFENES